MWRLIPDKSFNILSREGMLAEWFECHKIGCPEIRDYYHSKLGRWII